VNADAYSELVEPHRGELRAHCYRMLGSTHDADDALQEALMRGWRALPRFEHRSSIRSWLYRIATNACLDQIAKRPRQRVLPIDYGPPSDPHEGPGMPIVEAVWIEPFPDAPEASYEQRESVELAFVAALQLLPARQRAVLVLREVLGFSAREVSETLDTTVASVNSALQRARKTIDDKLPDASQQATMRALGDAEVKAIVERYMDAWERGDVDGIVALLAEDATITMPPMATWFRGEGVVVFLTEWAFSGRAYNAEGNRRVRVLPAHANGQPAIATYAWNDVAGAYLPTVLQVLTFAGERVAEITGFVDPTVFPGFGLPESLDGGSGSARPVQR
jgi:RNA polymerase sigma-70 factor, ECF subfamily